MPIGHPGEFSLTRWSLQTLAGFHVPMLLRSERNLVVPSDLGQKNISSSTFLYEEIDQRSSTYQVRPHCV